jgi:hypothetical protein
VQCPPSDLELVESVRAFLIDELLPELTGAAAYNTRVAANILKIVERSLNGGSNLLSAEKARLRDVLGGVADKSYADLNRDLSIGLRTGSIDWNCDTVRTHMFQTVLGRLGIDNPKYSTYKEMAFPDSKMRSPK